MNIIAQAWTTLYDTTLELVKKTIPTVIRQTDAEFLIGNRLARLFGGTGKNVQEDIYASHPWVYAAINAIARNISQVPFVFRTSQGPTKGAHAFTDIFERPNRWQGWGQLMEAAISWLHLRGEVMFILRRDDENKVPKEMAAVDSTRFEPVFDKITKRLIGWLKVLDNGETVPFKLHEVIYIRFWNPLDEWRGLSPISPAKQGISQDLLANQFNTAFYRNAGSPDGVIETDNSLTDEQFERLYAQYENKHAGGGNSHKMLLLEGGAKWKQTTFTQKDMEFLKQKKWNRDETLAVFNVPKMQVGIMEEGANLAVIKIQAKQFWLDNLIPKMKLIEWALWAQLFSRINGGRVWAEYDVSNIEALKDGFHELVVTARSLWEMGWTANQINQSLVLNLPTNKWQNFGYIPLQIQPIAMDTDGVPATGDITNPQEDPLTKPKNEGGEASKPADVKIPTEAAQAEPSKHVDAESAQVLTKRLKTFFYKQRVRQLKALAKSRAGILDVTAESDQLDIYLDEYAATNTCKAIVEYINGQVVTVVSLYFEDETRINQEVKRLYTNLDKQLSTLSVEILRNQPDNVFV